MKRLPVRLIFGFFGLFLIAMLLFQFAARDPDKAFFMPQIGLEFGMIPAEMADSLPEGGTAAAMQDLQIDNFGFIPAYIILFLLLAFYLRDAIPANGKRFFYVLMACVVIAAIADWTENHYIGITLSMKEPGMDFTSKYTACFLKWFMIGLAVFLTSLGYFFLGKYQVAIPGFINAALLVIGVIFAPALIQWGFGMMGLLLLLAAIFS